MQYIYFVPGATSNVVSNHLVKSREARSSSVPFIAVGSQTGQALESHPDKDLMTPLHITFPTDENRQSVREMRRRRRRRRERASRIVSESRDV